MKNPIKYLLILLFLTTAVSAQNFEIDLLRKVNVENPAEDHFWMGVSNSVKWAPAVYVGGNLTYGLIENDKNALSYSLESSMSMGVSILISSLLKKAVGRPRPSITYPEINSYKEPNYQSFPSSHSAFAFAMTISMAYHSNGRAYVSIPIFSWPIGVGYSRMRLGRHYPTDVLGGAIIGIGSGIFSHWLTGRIIK
ncbi:MAG: phosphatase PAP2 family protein [Moheibacter sp.]